MSLLRRLTFNLWYFGSPPWDSGISPPELFEFIGSHTAGRAIDLGCGTGTNVVTLARAGWEVIGIDFASRAIQSARRKAARAGVTAGFFAEDATNLENIEGSFDLALDIGCFHGVATKKDYLVQLDRILASDGIWLMYGFLKKKRDDPGPGLVEKDLELITTYSLKLLDRQDGYDKQGRPSAWFKFKHIS